VRKRQGPGRQLPLLHHRAKRGHRRRARRPPGAAQVGAVQAVVGAVQAEPGWSGAWNGMAGLCRRGWMPPVSSCCHLSSASQKASPCGGHMARAGSPTPLSPRLPCPASPAPPSLPFPALFCPTRPAAPSRAVRRLSPPAWSLWTLRAW
jgi:hypothetical protein